MLKHTTTTAPERTSRFQAKLNEAPGRGETTQLLVLKTNIFLCSELLHTLPVHLEQSL